MRPSQIIGLAWARPGMGVCQRTFSLRSTFHVVGNFAESSTPLACGPRNCGQFAVAASEDAAWEMKQPRQSRERIPRGKTSNNQRRSTANPADGYRPPAQVANVQKPETDRCVARWF